MDYSFCSNMFTLGQAQRMQAALNSSQAGRNNLWTSANLVATGVSPTLAVIQEDSAAIEAKCAPIADFTGNYCYVCQGAKVQFTDESWNARPTGWNWTFTGATIASSTTRNPLVTFDSLWSQTITLTASDAAGSSSITKSHYVFVSPLWASFNGNFTDGFENNSLQWLVNNQSNDGTYWQQTSTAAYSGNNCLYLNSFAPAVYTNNTIPPEVITPAVNAGNLDDVMSPAISFQYVAAGGVLSFDYSCASAATDFSTLTETLTVGYSTNCGQSWANIATITGLNLANVGYRSSSFVPASQSDWVKYSVNLPGGVYHKPNVRFRLEYTSGVSSNNIYIDNVNISGVLSTDDMAQQDYNANLYPNPTNGNSTLSYTLPKEQNVSVLVTDMLGQQVAQPANEMQSAGQHSVNISKNGLPNGVYFIRIYAGNSQIAVKKLVILQ